MYSGTAPVPTQVCRRWGLHTEQVRINSHATEWRDDLHGDTLNVMDTDRLEISKVGRGACYDNPPWLVDVSFGENSVVCATAAAAVAAAVAIVAADVATDAVAAATAVLAATADVAATAAVDVVAAVVAATAALAAAAAAVVVVVVVVAALAAAAAAAASIPRQMDLINLLY